MTTLRLTYSGQRAFIILPHTMTSTFEIARAFPALGVWQFWASREPRAI